jgi:tripartite-type tricarboxylate transporter receptor subunit TctC
MKLTLRTGLMILACLGSASHAQQKSAAPAADDYPNKTVRIWVSAAPGGGIDIFSRTIAQKLSETMKNRFIVENKPDGGGSLAIETLRATAPDGYTIYVGGGELVLAGPLKKVKFDVRSSYTPIVEIANSPYYMVAASNLPVNTVKEFIDYVKARPGAVNYGSSGVGSTIHLGIELLSSMTGMKMVHIPYKGNSSAYPDLASGQIQLMFGNPTSSMPFIKSGKIKLLATTGGARVRVLPDVPTVEETVDDFEHGNSSGVYGPAGIPTAIVLTINRAVTQAANSPEIKARIERDGSEVVPPHTPEEFRARFLKRIARWEAFIPKSGIDLGVIRN